MRALLALGCLILAISCGPRQEPATRLKLGLGILPSPADRAETGSVLTYQLGSEWGKKLVTPEAIANLPTLERIAKGTGRIGGGTGFYLGKFAGEHVVATNHHVCPAGFNCLSGAFSLPLLQKSYRLSKFVGTWDSVDLSLLIITVPPEDEGLLEAVSNPFRFDHPIEKGQTLTTVGFGIAGNPSRQLVYNADADCRVLSEDGDFRLLADPDSINPAEYEAWSFANACDVSHGDSGSAMVDRSTGEVLGLIWTGKIPKMAAVQTSAYLEQIEQQQDAAVWTELSYSVPAEKIAETLRAALGAGKLDAARRAVIEALL